MDMDRDDNDARVHDFLDDKLQTVGDLDSLDELLASINAQHGLLRAQLDDAHRDLDGAKHHQREHHATQQDRAQEPQHQAGHRHAFRLMEGIGASRPLRVAMPIGVS